MSVSVFLVDDHSVVRDGLSVLLETQQDLRVVGSSSGGRRTIQQIVHLRPDVVVMDIAMPEMNGIEATAQIHDASTTTRVLILSMYSSVEHIFRAFQAGAQGYLLKESAGAELVEAIRAMHDGRRYLSQKIAGTVIEDYIRSRDLASPLDKLSRRERQLMQLIAEGRSNAEAAALLFLSQKTVETYRSRMMQKLGIGDIASLVKFAIQYGLTTVE